MKAIIAFSGTDGAGKSTQIERLEGYLRKKGVSTKRFWARGGYTPLFSFAKDAARKFRRGALPKPGCSSERQQRFASKRVRRVWLTIAIFDLILCYGIWLRLQVLIGRTVICDRYIHDTRLDFNSNFPEERVETWPLWRILVWIAPKPKCHFLLTVPPDESARRSKLKNEPFPDSPEVLAWRYVRYQELGEQGIGVVIDCQHPIENVHEKIVEEMQLCV